MAYGSSHNGDAAPGNYAVRLNDPPSDLTTPMLSDFENIAFNSIDVVDVVVSLLVALGCGLLISLVYRWTYRGASYAPGFVRSLIFLAMITALVMMVIGNNLARAFGLVGAMSIIRFRTALKDPQDIVFVFFALATGLAAGVGMYMVALVSTASICLVIVATTASGFGVLRKQSFVLQLSYEAPAGDDEATYGPVLRQYCKDHKLISARTTGPGDALDLTFLVSLKRKADHETLTRALGEAAFVRQVNVYYDEEPS